MMTAPPQQHHFFRPYPGAFINDHAMHVPNPAVGLPQDINDVQVLREQVESQARTATHYRNWASQLQARYQMFSPDAARPAKRVYIGNLPSDLNDSDLRTAINDLMAQIGAAAADGASVTSCKLYPGAMRTTNSVGTTGSSRSDSPERLPSSSTGAPLDGSPRSSSIPTASSSDHNHRAHLPHNHDFHNVQDKSYAFVEFRTVEEASNCMALDGVRYKDAFLKVRRPNNYDPGVAIMLGPIEPNPALDFSGLEVVRTVVQDSPHKVFIGGLPCDWTEEQVTEMLLPFGPLKAFNLVMDRATGNSRGYAFCEFIDVGVTDQAIQSLHGKPVGNKYLTVKRALGPTPY